MKTNKGFYLGVLALGVAALIAACAMQSGDEPGSGAAVRIDADDIGGVVASAKGPEAGVWVIAETTELPTRFSRSVVTDDQGRYVLPDLPKAGYSIWVRGYGLVDSPKVKATPGKIVNLTAVMRAERSRRGAILSGDLLVFDDEDSGQERVRRRGKTSGQADAG